MPTVLGAPGYMDVWQPARAVELIAAEGVTWTMEPRRFWSDLAYAPNLAEHCVDSRVCFSALGRRFPASW
jgi:hypothetical protein